MRKQTGFTLIEVLITVVVLAIGLLGLAGLQATALSYNSTAYQRSQATSLTYDIIDRARANLDAARAGDYSVAFGFGNQGDDTLAQQDLSEWRQALINTLPFGTAEICWVNTNDINPLPPEPNEFCNGRIGLPFTAANNNLLLVIVRWNDSRGQEADRKFMTVTEL